MNNKIAGRTMPPIPAIKGGHLADTDSCQKFLLERWREVNALCEKWIASATSVGAATPTDLDACKKAVKSIYRMAGVQPPEDRRIVFVSSPFAARFAAGFAAAGWSRAKAGSMPEICPVDTSFGKTGTEIYHAVLSAMPHRKPAKANASSGLGASKQSSEDGEAKLVERTHYALRAATYGVVYNSLYDAIDDEVRDLVWDATRKRVSHVVDPLLSRSHAAFDAIVSAITGREKASADSFCTVDGNIAAVAEVLGVGSFGIACAKEAADFMHVGSSRAADDAYLDFFKSIAGIDINWSPITCCELLAKHTDWRFLHRHFCILSLKPVSLRLNKSDDLKDKGESFCQWADGSRLHGSIRLPDLPLLNVAAASDGSSGKRITSSAENMELLL